MSKTSTPEIVRRFTDLLWANCSVDWVLKNTYFQGTLFIVISIPDQYRKIRRSFKLNAIHKRSDDLWGMAEDCIDEMRNETTQR